MKGHLIVYNFMLRIAQKHAEMITENEIWRTRALDKTEWVPVVREAKTKLEVLIKVTLS
jgi:hypothetical protein